MRWVFFLFIPLAVLALEVIVDPYYDLYGDENDIQVYTYNSNCECPEPEYKPNKLFLDLDI